MTTPLPEFAARHIGPRDADIEAMLQVVGHPSLDALVDAAIPAKIRAGEALGIEPADSEAAVLAQLPDPPDLPAPAAIGGDHLRAKSGGQGGRAVGGAAVGHHDLVHARAAKALQTTPKSPALVSGRHDHREPPWSLRGADRDGQPGSPGGKGQEQ